ncbi:MAG TPA: hypothetical protein VFK33_16560 [Bacillales bacterium]|nr:hypothetical protein [Bacillales bacterium]
MVSLLIPCRKVGYNCRKSILEGREGKAAMKNVVINTIVKYVFTEGQMRSAWKQHKQDLDYDSLTDKQLMELAKGMLAHTSHRDLEHHTLGSVWRTKQDFEGRMMEEDDSDPSMHVELIDTSQQGRSSGLFIDRMLRLCCKDCGFEFFIEDLDRDVSSLNCPVDGGTIEMKKNTEKRINKE